MLETFCKFKVVGEAGDAQAAIRAADEVEPNVILMDVNLPGMNGIEATKQIKSAHPSIQVVGLSMLQSPGIRDAMMQEGATSYLTKGADANAAVRDAATTLSSRERGPEL
ncbi:MAG: response regulator transcription factor [Planctomycetes bacterium]|nr:response regulator transcription factor [Planctomycetota bacterium]